MARIAIVEDDEPIRAALAELLQKNGHEAVAVDVTEDVAASTLSFSPDLVLLDLNLPCVDGTLVCRELRSRSDVPIIVVTSRTGEVDEVMCMTLGADDFVAKPYSSHVLLARIDALLRRAGGMSGAVLTSGCKNELRILCTLMRAGGTIVPRETLMEELWDSGAFVDDNTLTVNVNRLRQKIARLGVTDYLVTHRGQGYSV